MEWPRRCLAACFCAKGDLLSQWRGYAGGTGGFALAARELLAGTGHNPEVVRASKVSYRGW
jgi:hypothetical protein